MQTFNEQLQEEAQILAEQARERSQTLAQQMREQSQNLSEQVEDGIQTLTVQAREILDPEEDDDDDWEQIPRSSTEEDPEDFFDALFEEDEAVSSKTTPATSQPGWIGTKKSVSRGQGSGVRGQGSRTLLGMRHQRRSPTIRLTPGILLQTPPLSLPLNQTQPKRLPLILPGTKARTPLLPSLPNQQTPIRQRNYR